MIAEVRRDEGIPPYGCAREGKMRGGCPDWDSPRFVLGFQAVGLHTTNLMLSPAAYSCAAESAAP